jgi:hypothetical protein
MQSLSNNRDGQNGGDRAVIPAYSTIRRNGNRLQTVSLVPRHYPLSPRPWGRRPHRSATKVQTRLIPFRPVTCAPGSTRVSSQAMSSLEARRSRMFLKGALLASFIVLAGMLAGAQSSAPVVTMSVTLPEGRTQELIAPESGLATVSLKDGTEYGFRPTIQDSMPWNRIVVTIFRMATTNAATQTLGEVEIKRGGSAVESRTNPSFKLAVPKVSPPATQTGSTS